MKSKAVVSDPRLDAYAKAARVLDQAFRVPGTSWRFGVEAILGLIPGAGDILGSAIGAYGLWVSRQLGAPTSIQVRMLLNLGLDAIAGAVPLAGDLFDFAFKAHVRNHALLASWLEKPHQTRRSSSALLVGAVLGLLVMVAGSVWVAVASIRWLIQGLLKRVRQQHCAGSLKSAHPAANAARYRHGWRLYG